MYEEQITQYAMRMIVSGVEVIFKTSSRVAIDALARYMAERKHWSDEKKLQELYKNNPYELMLQKGKQARMMVMKADAAEKLIDRCNKSNIECYIQGVSEDPNLVVVTFNAEHANVIERFIQYLGIYVNNLENDVEFDNSSNVKNNDKNEQTVSEDVVSTENVSEEISGEPIVDAAKETLKTPEGFPGTENNTDDIKHEEVENGEPIVKPKAETISADINNRTNNERAEKSSNTENFYQARNETDENRSEQISSNMSNLQNQPQQSIYPETTKNNMDSDQQLKNSKSHKQVAPSSMQMGVDSRSNVFAVQKESFRDTMKKCAVEADAINKNRKEKTISDQTR